MIFITLIVGLPGSGKTHLANQLSAIGFFIVDDIASLDDLPDATNIAIIDVNFCDENILKQAKIKLRERYNNNVMFDVLYFENYAAAARRNVEYRNDGREVEGTIQRFEKIYQPPPNSRPIWNPPKPLDNI